MITSVTYEVDGNYSVQRSAASTSRAARAQGLGDINGDGKFTTADVDNATNCFETYLYTNNGSFDAAADINGDGKIDDKDLFALPAIYAAADATAAENEVHNVIVRRGNINGTGGTDGADITALYQKINTNQPYYWYNDLNSDGVVNQADVDTLVHTILNTEYGDANLDGIVNASDFDALASHYGHSGSTWGQGDFNGDGIVNTIDFNMLALHYNFHASANPLGALVPEPGTLSLLAAMSVASQPAAQISLAIARRAGFSPHVSPRNPNGSFKIIESHMLNISHRV